MKTIIATLALFTAAVSSASAQNHEVVDWTSPTLIEGRANMFYPGLTYLTFQHMDKLFATREVEASGDVWALLYAPRDIGNRFTLNDEGEVTLDRFLEATRTNAFLVIKDGEIVYETYRNGAGPDTRLVSFSMAKSITSTLIGLALADGYIESLDDPVTKYVPELEGSGYDGVSIRDVLLMRSGVAWEERYEFGSDTQLTQVHDNALVAYNYRWCDYATDQSEPDTEPGSVFNYATLDTSVLGCVLESAIGKTGAEYMSEKIWKPAGMEKAGYWIMDGPEDVGREFYGAGFNATLRDYGRFGLMILNDGVANGTQIVPSDWLAEATVPEDGFEPTSEGAPFGYQYQWWTLPDSNAFAAIGLHDQYIFIDPDSDTVIVKLSYSMEPLGREEETIAAFERIVANLD
ncbi:serine hydrolase domain-containing protein [Pelagibacterium halotolerans]|uniref:serine hydrolase domain-containing protein n=1 Tax=Pelagibacterium halotolerans TaxID=531813 RepID=UPI0038509745